MVITVNYPWGKAHLLAGQGEWYAGMQDDLVDAVRWAIAEGIADPNRVVIKGAPMGVMQLWLVLTRDPSIFAAAVSEVGPSNLRTLLASIPAYWEAIRINWERMIGVGTVDLEISPINHVSRIQSTLAWTRC